MTSKNFPTSEQHHHLLNVVYANDPQPPDCPDHTDPAKNRHVCTMCLTRYKWRERMYDRFAKRGFKFRIKPFDDNAEPAPCPAKHVQRSGIAQRCEYCIERRNWIHRRRDRLAQMGIDRIFTDMPRLIQHTNRLYEGGMTLRAISRAANCGIDVVARILGNDRQPGHATRGVADRLLAVPVPDQQLKLVRDAIGRRQHRVSAIGVHRRIQTACAAGHSIANQSRRLGYSSRAACYWLKSPTVEVSIADAMAQHFPTLIARPGTDRTAIQMAERNNWPSARYFSETNIDDPDYDPFRTVRGTCGLYRRLRALAWWGQGPQEVAAFIGEPADVVERWMLGGPAPMYAFHLADAAFEQMTGAPGPDEKIAEHARQMGWAPPLAWHGIDIDDPQTQPHVDLRRAEKVSDYPLDSQVHFALAGRVKRDELLHDELVTVVHKLLKAGWTDRRIVVFLRWNDTGDQDAAITAFRRWRARADVFRDRFDMARLRADTELIDLPAAA